MTESKSGKPSGTVPALEFENVTFRGAAETSIGMDHFTGSINEGEFVQVKLRQHHNPRCLASAMLGLQPPQNGDIRFRGQDWKGRDHARHFDMRTQIGRVFAGSAWVNNLTVRDNVMLSMRHHGVSESDAQQRFCKWTDRLTVGRSDAFHREMRRLPSLVEPSTLQVCQWIRAVCNHPKLLILERPLHFILEALHVEIISIIEELREAGTAILVFCGTEHEEEYCMVRGVTHWGIDGNVISQEESSP